MRLLPILLLLVSSPALALVSNYTAIDDRDPIPMPYPLTLERHDVFLSWQNEIHWDTTYITLSDGQQRSRSPGDGQNTLVAGWKAFDDFAFYLQTSLAFRNQSLQGHAQWEAWQADDDFPLDFTLGGGLGYSAKGELLPEGQFILSRTFRPPPHKNKRGQLIAGHGVSFSPQLVTGLRVLGQAFADAGIDGQPGTAYAGVTTRRLVFDTSLVLEASFAGFVGRLCGGYETLVQTLNVHEDTAGSNFRAQSGAFAVFTLGWSFSTEAI